MLKLYCKPVDKKTMCDNCKNQKHCTINPNRNDCLLFELKRKN